MMLRFIFFCLSFSLISCTLIGPDYKRPESNLPGAYHQEINKDNVAADLNMWWKLYQDPALNELMDKALVKNTDINFRCNYIGSYKKGSNNTETRENCLKRYGYTTPEELANCLLCDPVNDNIEISPSFVIVIFIIIYLIILYIQYYE